MNQYVHTLVRLLRHTQASPSAAVVRLALGGLFLMTGVMKLAVPELRAAFSGQLTAAGIPLHDLNMWAIPSIEIGVGMLFGLGLLTRLASLTSAVMMLVATYVHLVVHDPALFPLQPEAPIIPLITIALCLYMLRAGGGAWSLDLHQTAGASRAGEASAA